MNKWFGKQFGRSPRILAIVAILMLQLFLLKQLSSDLTNLMQMAVSIGLAGLLGLSFRRGRADTAVDSLISGQGWQRVSKIAAIGLWQWDFQRNWLLWTGSDKEHSLTGASATLLDLVHPEDHAALKEAMQTLRQSPAGTMMTQEFRVRSVRPEDWLVATGQVIQGDRAMGVTIDITPYKQAELDLQRRNAALEAQVQIRTAQLEQASELETRLKRITDKVRDSLDEAQILQTVVQELGIGLGVRCCTAALYDLDRSISTICYEYNSTMFPLKGQVVKLTDFTEVYDRLLQGECLQFYNIVPDPMRGRVAMLACPIANDRGVLGDLWMMSDKDYAFREIELRLVQQVSNQCAIAIRQARLYQAAQAEVEALERINWLKDEFLSTVSHELRTPVANMKLSIRLLETALKTEDLSAKTVQYLQILSSECDREIRLINDLLDLQRLEAGRRSLTLESIDLALWLPQFIDAFEARLADRQQQLRVELPAEKLPLMVTDLVSLDRILSELLNNACKYTPLGGEITLKVQVEPATIETSEIVVLSVCNSGVEIPAEEIPRLFDKFYRIPQGDPWNQGGTGLGLALVKRLVDLLEGSIEVSSKSQHTCFQIELPNLTERSLPL